MLERLLKHQFFRIFVPGLVSAYEGHACVCVCVCVYVCVLRILEHRLCVFVWAFMYSGVRQHLFR